MTTEESPTVPPQQAPPPVTTEEETDGTHEEPETADTPGTEEVQPEESQ